MFKLMAFILYCLFNEPPGLNMFIGGGNKNKNKILKYVFLCRRKTSNPRPFSYFE